MWVCAENKTNVFPRGARRPNGGGVWQIRHGFPWKVARGGLGDVYPTGPLVMQGRSCEDEMNRNQQKTKTNEDHDTHLMFCKKLYMKQ